jgi:hypothetical protein
VDTIRTTIWKIVFISKKKTNTDSQNETVRLEEFPTLTSFFEMAGLFCLTYRRRQNLPTFHFEFSFFSTFSLSLPTSLALHALYHLSLYLYLHASPSRQGCTEYCTGTALRGCTNRLSLFYPFVILSSLPVQRFESTFRRGVDRFVSQSGGLVSSKRVPRPVIGFLLSRRSTMHDVSPPTSSL